MLTLTENASTIIKRLTDGVKDSPNAGLRIGAKEEAAGLKVEIAPAPAHGDQVVEAGGARVFLDLIASPGLAEKELDAQIDDGSVRFTLRTRK